MTFSICRETLKTSVIQLSPIVPLCPCFYYGHLPLLFSVLFTFWDFGRHYGWLVAIIILLSYSLYAWVFFGEVHFWTTHFCLSYYFSYHLASWKEIICYWCRIKSVQLRKVTIFLCSVCEYCWRCFILNLWVTTRSFE